MNWRNKATLAKLISKLPSKASYRTYYFIQRHFGALRSAEPVWRWKAGVTILDLIRQHRRGMTGTETFLEVGSGWSLSLPMALWLCGAFRTITVDLNPYLKPELVFEEIEYIKNHRDMVTQVFGAHCQKPVFRDRLDLLLGFDKDLKGLLSLMNVEYVAPADAASLSLAAQSIDYHISYNVVQHVTREALAHIFLEAKRVLKPQGLAIHYVTFADLFSSVDHSISPINFLQFNEDEWDSIAGNRYMYHNRLRVDELRKTLEEAGLKILELDAHISTAGMRALEDGELCLDPRFRDKSRETNATANAWITAARS